MTERLEGLDLARYLAFVGMVIVNFKIAMGAEAGVTALLEGRAAATFVVLAGIGLGLAGAQAGWVTLRRAVFLLVAGLLNMLIFEADILHYYAFYFLFGVALLPLPSRALVGGIIALNVAFVVMILTLNYEAGWDWETYSYAGFWTPQGFIRNLFFNGWHPVVPWLGFLLFGVVLARLPLADRRVQRALVLGGLAALLGAEVLRVALSALDPELAELVTTQPVPPLPLYVLAGIGAASLCVGGCLLGTGLLHRTAILAVVTPAGRQTLTLYIAHIIVGMGTLEELGLLGGQSERTAFAAAGVFCVAATLFSWVWARRFKRGPVEALMRATAG